MQMSPDFAHHFLDTPACYLSLTLGVTVFILTCGQHIFLVENACSLASASCHLFHIVFNILYSSCFFRIHLHCFYMFRCHMDLW